MSLQPQQCYSALKAHDARFDGVFYVGVSSTGIYCRPICRVRLPAAENCRFFAHAANAEAAGYRPCLRCRPELAPGTARADAAQTIADRAVACIEAGALSNDSVEALAARFGIGARQLRRLIVKDYGVTPSALAQTQRLLLAKQLLADSTLGMAEVAFASGFTSVRRFNHAFRHHYGLTPGAVRRQRHTIADADGITLQLGYRPPLAWSALTAFLAGRGARNVEHGGHAIYQRTLQHAGHKGWIHVANTPDQHMLRVTVAPTLAPVMPWLRSRLRRLFDLDADPAAIAHHLGHSSALASRVEQTPGLRIPGTLDGFELALRTVLGQQISVKAATTLATRFAAFFGTPITTPFAGLTRLAPTASAIANADLQQIIDRGLPGKRAATIQRLAQAVADGSICLDGSVAAATVRTQLQALPGIGPWTAHYISMRALGDPDAFPERDLGLLRALDIDNPRELQTMAEAWRPWRAYAAMYIWHQHGAGG